MKLLIRSIAATALITGLLTILALAQGCGMREDGASDASLEAVSLVGSDIDLTGNIRLYQSGGQQALQIDIINRSSVQVFGPNVSVNLEGVAFLGGAKMYPYYGGNTSTAHTVFPGDKGYVLVKLPVGESVSVGQTIRVTLSPQGSSTFSAVTSTVAVCKKGTPGCE